MPLLLQSNFRQLRQHGELGGQLLRLGMLAEKYFSEDPNTCLLKLRQFAELLAQRLGSLGGIAFTNETSQFELLHRLRVADLLPAEVYGLFTQIRITRITGKLGN